jgi:proline racemase
MTEIQTTDYHTAGEPFRIVRSGVPPLEGASVLAKRRFAAERLDHVRRLLVHEPRGHADMYGGFVTEPDDAGADLGCVFFHNAGYSTACGHGTIALATWAIDEGVVAARGPETTVTVDVPSGRVRAVARLEGGRVGSVSFANVASFVHTRGLEVEAAGRRVAVDIAFGGAFYAVVDAAAAGCGLTADDLPELIATGRVLKTAIEAAVPPVAHPEEPELAGIYGLLFVADAGATGDGLRVQRNVAVFADGEVDRSPTGSGVSARLALLHAAGELGDGQTLVTESITGQTFAGRVTGEATVAGHPAVLTEVEGSAYRTGEHRFLLDPRDPLGEGFLLR